MQPALLCQITLSQKHEINNHGLVTAVSNLRFAAANAKLVFTVTLTAFAHDHGIQHATAFRNRPDLTSLARLVKHSMIDLPIQRYARSETAAADAAIGLSHNEHFRDMEE